MLLLQLPASTNWLRARSGRVYVGDALNQIPADPADVFGLLQDGATVVHPSIVIDPAPPVAPTVQEQAALPMEEPISTVDPDAPALPDAPVDLLHEAG